MNRLAAIMVLILLAAPVSGAFAGDAAWGMSQMRARHNLRKWEKRQTGFWKKFDVEMDLTQRDKENDK